MEVHGIYSENVVLPDENEPVPACILIKHDKITNIIQVGTYEEAVQVADENCKIENLGDLIVSPGIIDLNVCFNSIGDKACGFEDEPTTDLSTTGTSYTHESWEGYEHGTKAAIAGGITTVLEHPTLRYPSMDTVKGVQRKISEIEHETLHCDVGLLGYVSPDNLDVIAAVQSLGVFGFKGYMVPPAGASFHYFTTEQQLISGMKHVGRVKGTLYLHSEKANERMLYLSSPFRAEEYENRPELSSPEKLHVFAAAFGSSPAASQGSSELNTSHSNSNESPLKSTPGSWVSYGNSPPCGLLETPERSEEKLLSLQRKMRKFGRDHEMVISAELNTYNQSGLTHYRLSAHADTCIEPIPIVNLDSAGVCKTFNRCNTIAQSAYTEISQSSAPHAPQSADTTEVGIRRRPAPIICKPVEEDVAVASAAETTRMDYAAFLANNPKSWESKLVQTATNALRQAQCRTHITNVSSASAVYELYNSKPDFPDLTFDNAAAHIYFCDEDINSGDTRFKTNPPIREARNRKLLTELLSMAHIDCVSSYHRAILPRLKCLERGDWQRAQNGLTVLGFQLPCLWTMLKSSSRRVFSTLARILSERPAAVCKLNHVKGAIAVNYQADLVIWDPNDLAETEQTQFIYPSLSPIRGAVMFGRVRRTYLRGQLVFHDGQVLTPQGQLLKA